MKSKIATSRTSAASGAARALRRHSCGSSPTRRLGHLDIAGVGMVDGGKKFGSPGSIGYGVRLLAQYVCDYASQRPARKTGPRK